MLPTLSILLEEDCSSTNRRGIHLHDKWLINIGAKSDGSASEEVEDFANISPVGVNIWRVDENMIQIDYGRGGKHIPEDIVHKVLENGWGITEPEGHHQIFIVPIPGVKSRLPFVPLTDANQVGGTSQIGDLTVCTALCQITDLTYRAAGFTVPALSRLCEATSLPAGPGSVAILDPGLEQGGRTGNWGRVAALGIHKTARHMQATQQDFEKAQNDLKTLKKDPGNDIKLKLYALFKQATQGSCNTPKPGMLDFVNKAKWDAWKAVGSLSQDDARKSYVELVSNLISSEAPAKASASPSTAQKYDTVQVVSGDNITKIYLNRPDKKNAITLQMYREIGLALDEAAKDDSVITVLTGMIIPEY
ncbi:unnamed protein product [Ranitomeya imitator]|uniref:ACB domain-containing protein n=1 Tax=Ranitomeya imitator TaxID=111125 RepID=A0ABN9M2K1_9NEOB|nr:unnamed protein product [Ranitomeya imitator]